jgi:uncharacterized protein YijF (DUF1287 family)/lipoprotein-anchoring transpeptidase ErfK/SrfK
MKQDPAPGRFAWRQQRALPLALPLPPALPPTLALLVLPACECAAAPRAAPASASASAPAPASARAAPRQAARRHAAPRRAARGTARHAAAARRGPAAAVLRRRDRGVFSRFDGQVRARVPPWIKTRQTSVVIDKARRLLVLRANKVPLKVYPIALGFTPKGHKQRQGDGKTPEGTYTIVERLHRNLAPRYGARSLRLSYPGLADAKRGRRKGLITRAQLRRIARAHRRHRMPPQRTALGGSIRLHGGGVGRDWTLGCVALRDRDVKELYAHTRLGTPVHVHAGGGARPPWSDRDGDGIPDQVDVLRGARKAALNGARYHGAYYSIEYPGGDIPAKVGVCTDVIIRAFRNAGVDLQAAVYRDVRAHRRRYRSIKRPDPNIDHRRVRNLLPYFRAHYRLVNRKVTAARRHTLLPGDVVFLDTLSHPGPDHLGIIADTASPNGWPQVINNWTTGYRTQAMDLLPSVTITHHFRISR